MQTSGVYVEQFLKINGVGYKDIMEEGVKSRNFKIADVITWHLTEDGEKREISEIRLECDDKLVFLSDVKALLLSSEIMKHLIVKQGAEVRETLKKILAETEVMD